MNRKASKKQTSRGASQPHAASLSRWETEGGALGPEPKALSVRWPPLSEQETQALARLGAAVLLQWSKLPADIQRELVRCSIAVGSGEIAQIKEQIMRIPAQAKGSA